MRKEARNFDAVTNIKILRIILIKYFIRCCVFVSTEPGPDEDYSVWCYIVCRSKRNEMRKLKLHCRWEFTRLKRRRKVYERDNASSSNNTKKINWKLRGSCGGRAKKYYSDKSEKKEVGFSARWMFSVLIAQQHKIKEKLSSLQRCSKNWSENKSLQILTIERVSCKRKYS